MSKKMPFIMRFYVTLFLCHIVIIPVSSTTCIGAGRWRNLDVLILPYHWLILRMLTARYTSDTGLRLSSTLPINDEASMLSLSASDIRPADKNTSFIVRLARLYDAVERLSSESI